MLWWKNFWSICFISTLENNVPVVDKDATTYDDKGLGTGPLIGIIVDIVTVPAIIAAWIAFFIWKKKKLVSLTSEPNVVETDDNNLQSIIDKEFGDFFNQRKFDF